MARVATASGRRALVAGIRGQDGSYLAELLLQKGYEVVGTSHVYQGRFEIESGATLADVEIVRLDITSSEQITELVDSIRPDEIYNFAARSSSTQLFDDPIATAEINGMAPVRFLEAIRAKCPSARYCQAGSSEVFAGGAASPQSENTAFRPRNAYGAAKAYATNMVALYRARFGLHVGTAILYNHESPRRGEQYVSRKISRGVAMIAAGQMDSLVLGSLDDRRDWGYAGDYVRAMWLMLQQREAADFVVASGRTHTVRDFCEVAFSRVGLDYRDFVRTDSRRSRCDSGIELCGDARNAMSQLGWQPSIGFKDLVWMMVDADSRRLAEVRSADNS